MSAVALHSAAPALHAGSDADADLERMPVDRVLATLAGGLVAFDCSPSGSPLIVPRDRR